MILEFQTLLKETFLINFDSYCAAEFTLTVSFSLTNPLCMTNNENAKPVNSP